MDPLASLDDLLLRGITVSDDVLAQDLLSAASSTVREAAGSPISLTTSTITLDGQRGLNWLRLPGQPIRSVSDVAIDGETVTDWRLANGSLWRRCGWGVDDGPAEVTLTQEHGLDEVPADIVDLVCNMAAAGLATASQPVPANVAAQRVGDFSVQYRDGEDAAVTAMDLPDRVRERLRSMFGGSAGVVGSR
jgi:hypothetical protein